MSANANPLTKADLVAALSVMKDELGGEIRAAKDELRVEIGSVRTEMHADLQKTREELVEMARDVETKLLTEFHRYAKGQQLRLHSLELTDADLKGRLANIEERLLALETSRPPSV
jgi:hypothetical protein